MQDGPFGPSNPFMVKRFLALWSRSLDLREQALATQRLILIEVKAVADAHRESVKDLVACASLMAEANAETARALSTYFKTYQDAMNQTQVPAPAFSEADLRKLMDGFGEGDGSLDPLLDAMP